MPKSETEDDPSWWLKANLYHVVSGGIAAALGGVYVAIWGIDRLLALDGATAALASRHGLSALTLLAVLAIAVVVVHELVHGVTYVVVGSHPPTELEVGLAPYWLAIYVRPTVPLRARAYRLGLAAPGVIAGGLPGIIGIMTGDAVLAAVGMYGVLITAADVATLVELRPGTTGATIPPPRERS